MNNAITVSFHNDELLIVEYNGQPYTPMKPIVDAMGLDWKSQYRKLTAGYGQNDHTPNRWGVVKITIPTLGDMQEAICLPLRKLFGWFNSISPNKVKPELRDKVIMYQTECDDVLWEYWTKGQAVNERKTISADDLKILEIMVGELSKGDAKVEKWMWRRLTRHFKIPHQKDLLAIHYIDAARFLHKLEIKDSHAQLPLLPVPFQKGRYLVVVGDDGAVKIRDAKGYELVDVASIDRFTKETLTMHVEISQFLACLGYLQSNLTLEGHKGLELGLLQKGENIIDNY